MDRMKRFFDAGWMGRCLCVLFLAGCLVPAAGMAACTEEIAERLVKQNLNLRLRFLENEGLMPVYEKATAMQSAQISQMIAARDWDGVCRGVFGVMEIADDVLAGGNGRTAPLKNPWEKCTPEKMLSLAAEYDLICQPMRRIENCAKGELMPLKRELIHLKAQAGKSSLTATSYVNRTCELYTELLKIINE